MSSIAAPAAAHTAALHPPSETHRLQHSHQDIRSCSPATDNTLALAPARRGRCCQTHVQTPHYAAHSTAPHSTAPHSTARLSASQWINGNQEALTAAAITCANSPQAQQRPAHAAAASHRHLLCAPAPAYAAAPAPSAAAARLCVSQDMFLPASSKYACSSFCSNRLSGHMCVQADQEVAGCRAVISLSLLGQQGQGALQQEGRAELGRLVIHRVCCEPP
jgi:hypothetical protein